MHIIAKSTLLQYLSHHPAAREKILAWHKAMEACEAKDFHELKQTFQSADYVPKKYTIFNIGGNDYRIVTVIHYSTQKAYIRLVGAHSDYDEWTKRNRAK